MSPANFLDWREQNQAFEQMAIVEPYSFRLTGVGEPESFRSWLASEGTFEILGVKPLYGRTFQPDEYRDGNDRVIVVGESLWRQRFGADPEIVGRSLIFNGSPHTIVGIMPASFQFPSGRVMGYSELCSGDVCVRGHTSLRGITYPKIFFSIKVGEH